MDPPTGRQLRDVAVELLGARVAAHEASATRAATADSVARTAWVLAVLAMVVQAIGGTEVKGASSAEQPARATVPQEAKAPRAVARRGAACVGGSLVRWPYAPLAAARVRGSREAVGWQLMVEPPSACADGRKVRLG